MKIERTKNTKRNTIWGTIEKIVLIVLPFATRSILLYLFGSQYLGLNGLFSSILQVLNMADLGIGTAIVFSMYKPIAEDNEEELCALLALYKKAFRIIGLIVLVAGLALVPFLSNFIEGDVPSDVNIYVVYLIYLFNTSISYFLFAYKKSLLHAYQRNDITTKVATALVIVQYGLQIGLLFVFSNYYLYLLVLPLITIISNIITAIITKKMFPSIEARGKVKKETFRKIKKEVGGLCISKICGVSRNSLDSIFISSFWGLEQVAIYGNYFYIMNAVHSFLTVFSTSVMAGVGNSLVCESAEKNHSDFKIMTFLFSWLGGWLACTLLCLYQPFMKLWVGDSFMFPFSTMSLFCIYLYSLSLSTVKSVYEAAAGLWWQNRKRALLELFANLFLNYFLGKVWGATGVILATIITMVLVNIIYGYQIVYKNLFSNKSLAKYYISLFLYSVVVLTVSALTYYLCSLIKIEGIACIFIRLGICAIIPNALFLLVYFRSSIFADSMPIVKRLLKK